MYKCENSTVKWDVYSNKINIAVCKNIYFERDNNRNAKKNIIIQNSSSRYRSPSSFTSAIYLFNQY